MLKVKLNKQKKEALQCIHTLLQHQFKYIHINFPEEKHLTVAQVYLLKSSIVTMLLKHRHNSCYHITEVCYAKTELGGHRNPQHIWYYSSTLSTYHWHHVCHIASHYLSVYSKYKDKVQSPDDRGLDDELINMR